MADQLLGDVSELRPAEGALDLVDMADSGSEAEVAAAPKVTTEAQRARRRKTIVLVLLAVLALWVADLVVGAASHAEHQRHLAAEFGQPLADLGVGDASYVLQIPALGVNEVVVEGSTVTELRGGPGRRLDSSVPGDSGNTVIQGQSSRFGGPFGELSALEGGNSIYLRSRAGQVRAYKVTKVRTVGSGDTKYLDALGPSRLTLVSSAAGPLDGRRVIVTAAADDRATEQKADATSTPPAPEEKFAEEEPSYDVRSFGGALLLVTGIGLLVVGLLGASGLRREYSLGPVLIVAGSSIALGAVLILFNLSAVLPTTF